jgi:hypothetical protein
MAMEEVVSTVVVGDVCVSAYSWAITTITAAITARPPITDRAN